MMFFSERKKLAEQYEKWISENKHILDCPLTVISWLVGEGYLRKTKVADLEAKLAESEHRNEQLVDALNGEVFINYKLPKENKELKQQLAEKDKEIAGLKLLVDSFDKLKQYDKDADLVLINPKTCCIDGKELVIKSDNQDKISFALEQLEKVKEACKEIPQCDDYGDDWVLQSGLNEYIDNQIKELKKEMK